MKAVLGLVFLFVGTYVAWLVISGKLSQLGSTSSTATTSVVSGNSSLGNITKQQINNRRTNNSGTGGGPLGIPTGAKLQSDFQASKGLAS